MCCWRRHANHSMSMVLRALFVLIIRLSPAAATATATATATTTTTPTILSGLEYYFLITFLFFY